jgi:hypothetical protein
MPLDREASRISKIVEVYILESILAHFGTVELELRAPTWIIIMHIISV